MKLEYLPTPQYMHALEDIEAVKGLNLPVEQLLQLEDATADAYFPTSQSMHVSSE